MKKQREHALEAVLMAQEIGNDTVEGALQAHEELRREDLIELQQEGILLLEGNRISLTPEGLRQAEDVLRRHRLTEALLFTVLGLSAQRFPDPRLLRCGRLWGPGEVGPFLAVTAGNPSRRRNDTPDDAHDDEVGAPPLRAGTLDLGEVSGLGSGPPGPPGSDPYGPGVPPTRWHGLYQ